MQFAVKIFLVNNSVFVLFIQHRFNLTTFLLNVKSVPDGKYLNFLDELYLVYNELFKIESPFLKYINCYASGVKLFDLF